jgi:hypothetical protein
MEVIDSPPWWIIVVVLVVETAWRALAALPS